ncbi:hypothetical protein BH09MYX1_BH09MYX1_58200 [soil metagenome]
MSRSCEASSGPGCNQLRCQNCGALVRASAAGFRAQESMRREDSPFVMPAGASWRLYACRCIYWDEGSEHFLVNDGDSPGDAHMNWRCGSHPVPVLPLALGRLTISTTTDWGALVQQILLIFFRRFPTAEPLEHVDRNAHPQGHVDLHR